MNKKPLLIITLILLTSYATFASALINPGDTLNPVVTNSIDCPNGPIDPTCIVTLPSSGSVTADNGLTVIGSNVQLGGALLQNTILDQDGKEFSITNNGTSLVSGADPLNLFSITGQAYPGIALTTDGTLTGGLQQWIGAVNDGSDPITIMGNFDFLNSIQAGLIVEGLDTELSSSDGISGSSNISLRYGDLSLSASNQLTIYPNVIQFSNFGSGRDDSGTSFPTNFLYTDGTGKLQSAPTSLLGVSLKWYAENATAPTTAPAATGTGSIALGDGAKAVSNDMFVYGFEAGANTTFVYSSNFIGYQAGNGADAAFSSNFIGEIAGRNAVNASGSNFFGSGAGQNATNAHNSNFLGTSAGQNATNAHNSNFLSPVSGSNATNADNSNFMGQAAGENAVNGFFGNFFGFYAGNGATNADNSNFLGTSAGVGAIDANNSNFFGNSAGYIATNANNSNFFGQQAGSGAFNADNSNFLGTSAGQNAIDASRSNFFGVQAGFNATNATTANFFGLRAGYEAGGASYANFFGSHAGESADSAYYSNFLGFETGQNADNANNSNFFGVRSGYGAVNAAFSNFFGAHAGEGAGASSYSFFVGENAGAYNISGSGLGTPNANNSIFIGNNAGYAAGDNGLNNTTNPDDFSILLGNNTSTGGFSNSIALGANATNTATNQFMIGSTTRPIDETKIIGSLGTECTITTGTGMACTSDERLKTNITDLNSDTLSKLQNVRTVSYNWLQNPDSPLQIGFLAQNLEQYFPEMVMTDTTGKKQVYYSQMTPILTKAIQELNLKVDLLSLNTGNTSPSVFTGLIAWFESTTNGIRSIVVKDKICVDDQCLTRDDIRGLLEMKNQGNLTTGVIPPVVVPIPDPVINPISDEVLTDQSTNDPVPTIELEQSLVDQVIQIE